MKKKQIPLSWILSPLLGERGYNKYAFTLIEIIVAITITSMVLVSIVEIFLFSGMFSKKIDTSRVMQENIKNFTEIIAEDVRTNWVNLYKNSFTWSDLPTLTTWTWTNASSSNSFTEYFLAKKDKNSWLLTKALNYSNCKIYKKEEDRCILVRKKWSDIEPLTSSHIAFENLSFDISGKWKLESWRMKKEDIPKVTMHFTVRPAMKKGLSSEKIKNAKIIMQTTFSERLYKYK